MEAHAQRLAAGRKDDRALLGLLEVPQLNPLHEIEPGRQLPPDSPLLHLLQRVEVGSPLSTDPDLFHGNIRTVGR
jgi:hypothetical protein